MDNLRFTKEHEWVGTQNGTVYVGISDYAQHSLGDIVFADLPKVGSQVQAGKVFGSVESVKAVSDIYAPVTGKVIEINEALADAPELLNEDPYENWLVAVELDDETQLDALMSLDDYDAFCAMQG